MEMNNSREERRRRIAESGSDRMALITGRLQSLKHIPSTPPPSPTPSSSYQDLSQINPSPTPLISQQDHDRRPDEDTSLKDHLNATLRNREFTKEVSRDNDCDNGNQTEPYQLDKYEGKIETTQVQPSIAEKASIATEPRRRHQRRLFTSKRLNSCIIASEGTRIFCALIIAFLVVLSYVDYPPFGWNIVRSESVVASRPLYILLLTDVTIVVAHLYLEYQREEGEEDEEDKVAQEDGHAWAQAVKVMERGLVVYQAIRGVFIDLSFYAVIVICGLSLV